MKKYSIAIVLSTFFTLTGLLAAQDTMTSDAAWDKIKTYQYGDDFKPLLIVEDDVQRSIANPETQAKTAARLAALLNDQTSYPGRQFVCMQLRLVGSAAQVPILAEYLNKEQDRENARMALEDIHCPESLVPLRKALETFKGDALAGVVNSLGMRRDAESIPVFVKLIGDADPTVSAAAATALGRFGDRGLDALKKAEGAAGTPAKIVAGGALIDAAADLAAAGKKAEASAIYNTLAASGVPRGVRRAALEGALRLLSDAEQKKTVAEWFLDDDADKNTIAAARLKSLSDEQFDELFEKVDKMSPRAKVVFYEVAGERQGAQWTQILLRSLQSRDAAERLTALRTLGKRGEAATIPALFDAMKGDPAESAAAAEGLARFSRETIGPLLLEKLTDPQLTAPILDVLAALKYYEAIEPLIRLAASADDKVADPAITGLSRLCDPDESDLGRLVELYLKSRPGTHRSKIERAVVVVSEKNRDVDGRGDLLLALLKKRDGGLSDTVLVTTLPLLGKVGNKNIADIVRPLTQSGNAELRQAAVRAFCNWPNAEFLDDLWKIATESASPQHRSWALRAYIRVATLKSNRPESETLDMLKKAMAKAENVADRQFCLSRTSAIRTMDSVDWAASYLDNPDLAQAACTAIVELAHHRFLREPNKDKIVPILEKVEKTAKDQSIVERANKSRLGM